MSVAPETGTVKRALSAHAAMGLLAGALLYIVCLSGAVVVFFEELQRIEQPGVPEMTAIDPHAAQRGIAAVLASEASKPPTTHLYLRLPDEALPRTSIATDSQSVLIDAKGAIVAKKETSWSDFLLALHYMLNVPGLIGITVVGLLGVMMLALSLSGVIAHPRIFRDAFRFRPRAANGLGLADWHNRMSVWSLPFNIAIALTGAVIGLGSIAAFGVAQTSYKGDVLAVYAPVFGPEGKPDKTPAPPPNVVAALAYMTRHHPGLPISYVTLHDPGTKGQMIQVVATPERRLVFGEYFNFDGDGRFRGTAGLSDGPIGQQAAASNYDLHFGNFGGLPVKIAYFVLGLALTGICATGTYIWIGKRERRGLAAPRLRALWDAVVWGSPLVLALGFVARRVLGDGLPLVAIFWVGLALVLAAAVPLAGWPLFGRVLRRALAGTLVLSVAVAIAGFVTG